MNFRNSILHILTNPFFIAFLLLLLFIPLVNNYFPYFTASINLTGLVEKKDGMMTYHDLDGDGRSEEFISFINTQGKPAYKVTNQDRQIIDQQEFEGDAFPSRCPLVFTDLNRNFHPEVVAFYQRRDSLFFSIIEYGEEMQKSLLTETFVSLIRNTKGKPDYLVGLGPAADLDGDSVDELVFSVRAGFPLIPRNHFIFHLNTGELKHSGFMGSTSSIAEIIDVPGLKRKAILLNDYAPGNMNDSVINGESDEAVTFRVLDEHLNPWFTPVRIPGEYGAIHCKSYTIENKRVVAVIYQHKGKPMNPSWLAIYDLDGQMVAMTKIGDSVRQVTMGFLSLPSDDRMITVIDNESTLHRYDFRLNRVKRDKAPFSSWSGMYQVDIDQDAINEYVIMEHDFQRLQIFRRGLSRAVSIETPHESYFDHIAVKENIGQNNELYVQYSQKYYLISYGKNPRFIFRYPAYLMVFLLLAGFIYMLQLIQAFRLRVRYQNERNVAAMQLKLVKKQVDPHFLFNVITTLSYNVLQKDPEEAYSGITKLARFMRSAVEWGDQIVRPLKAELEVVRTYLDLFSKQHPGKFEYHIEIREPVNLEQLIPVMIIQSFVENSIKHGIKAREGAGRVIVRAFADQKNLYLEIEDNGVGRKVASQVSEKGTGKGLNLMQQYVDLLNKVNEGKVGYVIRDLHDTNGEAAGTLVRVSIPLTIKYLSE